VLSEDFLQRFDGAVSRELLDMMATLVVPHPTELAVHLEAPAIDHLARVVIHIGLEADALRNFDTLLAGVAIVMGKGKFGFYVSR
jgi:hypothetical protein